MSDLLPFLSVTAADAPRVGGKGFSLGRSIAADLPVPPGFVVTTDAYRRLQPTGVHSDAAFVTSFAEYLRQLGDCPVAVRSSATGEDGSEASFAGQQETILGVRGLDAVLDAVERCWASLHTERAKAYRAKQGVDDSDLAMAVVVQELVPADAAGVLFTRDPLDTTGRRMLVEAAWGLGEVVVSGRVTPDRFTLDRDSGAVLDRRLGAKDVRVGVAGEEAVSDADRARFCLSDSELSRLADLGRRVEAFDGEPRDIEWAVAGGRVYLLQSRPITVATAADRETALRESVEDLRAKAAPGGTVWVRYNLSEVLPAPTPMTWGVVQRLLAADGGFGAMNRDLGAPPDPGLGALSAFDLVAGRPMANLSRMPRMQGAHPPFEYPFAALKADPRKALDPKPTLNPLAGGGLMGWLRLPATVWRLTRLMSRTKREAETFAERFTTEIVPPFVAAAREALARDWARVPSSALVAAVQEWTQRTLVDFARHSLKPTVFADLCWSTLVERLKPAMGDERARAAVGELSLGAQPPADAHLAGGLRDLAAGTLGREEFLERFGHRGPNEMELSQPRWAEVPHQLDALVRSGDGHRSQPAGATESWDRVAAEAKLTGTAKAQAGVWVNRLRTYLGLREAAKHYLLLGYAVIRRALVTIDRRYGFHGGVFYLLPDELPLVIADCYTDLAPGIAQRRKRRQAELSLEVPPVLFSDDLEAIGRPLPAPDGGDVLTGVALSAGTAEGPALVLTEPTAPPTEGGYVLVCPSTDPAWVPLFARAAGLVMETGGVLSHGAIVAREFGLPAVAGLPGAVRRLRTGQRVRVDGGCGTVTVLE
ncbi:PEP/pyruvate-binding domain-containing protein [Urbifossiella limnaea]|uniref:Phosphoenolpyruvate synthase n=1 Tax=Urbifossiella limnaea TaxID=2528023 RepID=A0A517XRW4_9BACT|nr:PEP/pyruvate-binding domain-containing protein [Urbifossiella limnaea]QDU20223.1 Phosphoenolpyruvate synthase [Urbifossiella limnaea]